MRKPLTTCMFNCGLCVSLTLICMHCMGRIRSRFGFRLHLFILRQELIMETILTCRGIWGEWTFYPERSKGELTSCNKLKKWRERRNIVLPLERYKGNVTVCGLARREHTPALLPIRKTLLSPTLSSPSSSSPPVSRLCTSAAASSHSVSELTNTKYKRNVVRKHVIASTTTLKIVKWE